MRNRGAGIVIFLALSGVLLGCSTPTYIDKGKQETGSAVNFSDVVFQVHDSYNNDPPNCIAVLPFKTPKDGESKAEGITLDQTESIRRAFYAHLSPQGKRDVEIPRVDFVLGQMSEADKNNLRVVGERLGCDALVIGEVTEYGSSFFGIYSKVAVGADLKMFRAKDGGLLWEGKHIAASHGGEIPFSPIGVAMGLIKASLNMEEEQLFGVIDNLARRLVTTIPDNRMAVLDEPFSTVQVAVRKQPKDAKTVDEFLEALEGRSEERQKLAFNEAIEANRFGDQGTRTLHQILVNRAPDDPENHSRFARYQVDQGDYAGALQSAKQSLVLNDEDHGMHFLTARVLIKIGNLKGADTAIVRAVALDDSQPKYLNGLGYVNSMRGNHKRALAAYRMALDRDPTNGFAYYNMGVTLFNDGDTDEAANAFYGAGLAYLKTGKYGQAEKALADLKDLASQGMDVNEEIKTLEDALGALTKGEKKDV